MTDMRPTIIPKSDQLNADDLIGREMTITITGVEIRGGQEQPVSIHFEGDGGKPYKACKSMCRVMVSLWGADSSKYVGRSMTLYRDPTVKWGGMEVGGIRISHMSDIEKTMTMALTMTRANKKPFTVRPLARELASKATARASSPQPASPSPQVPAPVAPDAAPQQNKAETEAVPPPVADAAPDEAALLLERAGSMSALAAAWAKIGPDARKRLEAVKESCKQRILEADKVAT